MDIASCGSLWLLLLWSPPWYCVIQVACAHSEHALAPVIHGVGGGLVIQFGQCSLEHTSGRQSGDEVAYANMTLLRVAAAQKITNKTQSELGTTTTSVFGQPATRATTATIAATTLAHTATDTMAIDRTATTAPPPAHTASSHEH